MATLITGSSVANGDWGKVYATNIIGMTGIDPLNRKYVLQIYDQTGTEKLADIRVSPNNQDVAFVDISYILQAQLTSKPKLGIDFEGTKAFLDGQYETATIQIWIGEEDPFGSFTIDETITDINIWRAIVNDEAMPWQLVHLNPVNTFGEYPHSIFSYIPQTFKEAMWSESEEIVLNPYLPVIAGDVAAPNCSTVEVEATPLTDFRYYKLPNQLEGVPASFSPSVPVLVQKITKNRFGQLPLRTVSILNGTVINEITPPEAYVNQCAGYYIHEFNGATEVAYRFEPNILSNGGGPNSTINQLPAPSGQWNQLHATVYDNMWTPNPATTHFYIYFVVGTPNGCSSDGSNPTVSQQPAWYPVRYDIQDNCSDYSPISVRWLNSAGGYDYFQFNKRHDESTTVDRNTFRSNKFDYWNAGNQLADMELNSRGEKVYSQKIQKEIKLTTDWLYDYEAEFLESLFKSADVSYIDQDQRWGANRVEQVIQATIIDKKMTEKTNRRNQLFQFEITLKAAYNLQSQRG